MPGHLKFTAAFQDCNLKSNRSLVQAPDGAFFMSYVLVRISIKGSLVSNVHDGVLDEVEKTSHLSPCRTSTRVAGCSEL